MPKRSRNDSINISDLPVDVLNLIISYSPKEFLTLSRYFCKLKRLLRKHIDVTKSKKYSIGYKSIYKTIFSSFNITTLIVSGWSKWNDSSVQYLSKLIQNGYFKSLNSIYMNNCYNVSNKSLHILLSNIGRNLIVLDLYNCKNVNYKVFGFHNPNLKALYLGFSKPSDATLDSTSGAVEHLFEYRHKDKKLVLFPKLEFIQLHNYIGINRISPIINVSNTLRHLDIRGCTGIEPSEFIYISHLSRLEEIHIGMPVPNEHLLSIINSCVKIRVLDISESNISTEVVQSICDKLPLISRIKLTKCNTLNNEGIVSLLSRLSNLTMIDVSHCWRLTNSFFDSLTKIASGNTLSKIGVYMCSLDNSKLVYKFNCAGANNVIPVIHSELQIDIKDAFYYTAQK